MGWERVFMLVEVKPKEKHATLPFSALEMHYPTKADVAEVATKIVMNAKTKIIMWVAGLQLFSIGIIIAVLK